MTDRNRAGDYGAPRGPYADVDVTRERAAVAGGNPLPFFGNNTPWVRPSLATFSTWLNQAPSGTIAGYGDRLRKWFSARSVNTPGRSYVERMFDSIVKANRSPAVDDHCRYGGIQYVGNSIS
jgi:hypothetical protein